jgi:hypothetical protein
MQPVELHMAELPVSELISLAEASGIVATLFVIFYFSRRESRNLSVDIETRVLHGLDEKLHSMVEMLVHRPELIKVLDKDESGRSAEQAFAYYILFMCAHAFHMRQRKVLSDNEWTGWLRFMRTAFEQGTIREHWEKGIEPEKWFDPAFQDFIDNEIIKRKP